MVDQKEETIVPNYVREAMCGLCAKEWREATECKVLNMVETGVWDEVRRPRNKHVVVNKMDVSTQIC